MRTKDLLLGISIMCLWGFNFSVIKLGADQINPILLTALRFTFATIPAVFFVTRPKVALKYLIAYGFTFGVGVWGMMTSAITAGVSAGMAGVLMQLSIVSSLFLGWFYLKERISFQKKIGALLALLGLLVSFQLQDGSVNPTGLVLVLIGAFSWSLIGLIVKKANTKEIFAFSVWGMLFAPVPLFALAWLNYGSEVFLQLPEQINASVWFSVLFQAYPTTLLGYWLWNRLIVQYPLTTTAQLTMLTPVFGMIGSMIFYQEDIDSVKFAAALLILSGLLVSQWQNRWFGSSVKQA